MAVFSPDLQFRGACRQAKRKQWPEANKALIFDCSMCNYLVVGEGAPPVKKRNFQSSSYANYTT
jgi:hypothetical protein